MDIHQHFYGVAIIDLSLTILFIWIIAVKYNIDFSLLAGITFLASYGAHKLFRVK